MSCHVKTSGEESHKNVDIRALLGRPCCRQCFSHIDECKTKVRW